MEPQPLASPNAIPSSNAQHSLFIQVEYIYRVVDNRELS